MIALLNLKQNSYHDFLTGHSYSAAKLVQTCKGLSLSDAINYLGKTFSIEPEVLSPEEIADMSDLFDEKAFLGKNPLGINFEQGKGKFFAVPEPVANEPEELIKQTMALKGMNHAEAVEELKKQEEKIKGPFKEQLSKSSLDSIISRAQAISEQGKSIADDLIKHKTELEL